MLLCLITIQIAQETSGTRFRAGGRSRDAGSRATSGDGSGGLGADGTGEGCRGGVCLSGLLRLAQNDKTLRQNPRKTACMMMTPSHKLVERFLNDHLDGGAHTDGVSMMMISIMEAHSP